MNKNTRLTSVLGPIAILVAVTLVLLVMGREPICKCGYVKLWHGIVNSAENSQHIFDWYSFTHVIHGFFFYGLLHLLAPRLSFPLKLCLAMMVEGGWEIFENTDLIINRYRAATISLDYFGDSVINSVSDILSMLAGFFIARKLPTAITVSLAILIEITLGYIIHDNLTLNIVMLLWPIEAIKNWQAGL